MPIRLTDKERSLLVLCLEKHKPNLLIQLSMLDSGILDGDLVKEMMDAVGSELIAKGFLKDDKKSYEYGKELESVINKLVDLYLRPAREKENEARAKNNKHVE